MNAPTGKIETGIVDIRGKQYQTVALRVQMFRQEHRDKALTTEIVERDPESVVMKAIITAEDGRILATGHSEEFRKSSQINRTSALENAETSAIGRALAAYGYGGTEFATANEVENAMHQQGRGGQSDDRAVSPPAKLSDANWALLVQLVETTGTDTGKLCNAYKVDSLKDFTPDQFADVRAILEKRLKEKADA